MLYEGGDGKLLTSFPMTFLPISYFAQYGQGKIFCQAFY